MKLPAADEGVGAPGGGAVEATLVSLRRDDRDRFLCLLASPTETRSDLATLYAFNAEIAGIAGKVSESMLGLIRLQWWRDALGEIAAGRGHRHYLVQALADLVARRGLNLALLHEIIDAREADLDPAPPADLAALEAYAARTAGALGEAALELCQRDPAPALRAAARAGGTAYGLIGLMRATSHFARRRVARLPAADMVAAGIQPDRFGDLRPGLDLNTVVAGVCARAESHLAATRQVAIPGTAIGAFLPARLARAQLERLRRHGYDPFVAAAIAGSGLDIWRLVLARWLRRP